MEKDIWSETNFYGVVDELEDKFSEEAKNAIKSKWQQKFGNRWTQTVVADEDFFTNFINSVPKEEQEKYIKNTIDYDNGYGNKSLYDPNYVLVTRRAVPSYESKPENFWSVDPKETLMGLKSEINKEQRMHSVIMVTTLQKLINHGIVITNRGVSDGEIAIDPNKNFNQFLFMYKPQGEFYSLVNFLEKGGISREELLTQLRNTAVERAIKQGLPLNQPEALPNVYPSDDDIQEMLDELDYEEKTDYFQQEVEEKQGIRMS